MDSLWQDLRYALRGLRNSPGFAALAVLTLALGIGATTTMYSVIYNVLIDPFPYVGADRVVAIQIRQADHPENRGRSYFKTADFLEYKEQNHVFSEVIATGGDEALLTTPEGTEHYDMAMVSENMFTFLGVQPLFGRWLTPEDAKPTAPPVFVMGFKMWTKGFGSDPSIIGKSYVINGVPTSLVGIMPKRFTKLNGDVYKPVILDRADDKLKNTYFMFQARLKPGVTLEQAEADISVIAPGIAKLFPDEYPDKGKFRVKIVSWVDNVVGPFRKTLTTLGVAVALLLFIACTNVANMLLARATTREREMAIRSSLGAGRGRLIRQLLIESLVLAVLGAIVGTAFAYVGIKVLVAYIPNGSIPNEAVISLNGPVLVFSLGVAMLTSIAFGLVPALQAAKKNLVEPLKDAGKGSSGGFRRGKLRNTLVVLEVTLSLMLLTGAGLLMRSFMMLTTVDLGFDANQLLIARLPLPDNRYGTAEQKQRYFNQLLPRIRAMPGVTAVTTVSTYPGFGGPRIDVEVPGKTHTDRWNALISLCDENYNRVVDTHLIRGRWLQEVDVVSARKVIVVNQEFVKRYFGTEDPVGRLVKFKELRPDPVPNSTTPPEPSQTFEIVGVTSDIRNRGPSEDIMPEALIPHTVTGVFDRCVLVRATGNPTVLANPLRREIWAQDRSVAVTDLDTLGNFLSMYRFASPRFSLLVLGVFAAVGLVLVTLGIYSVVAYTVSRQTHELGIRLALGATPNNILQLVLRMGLGLVLLGAMIGLLVSLILARVLTLTNELWHVSPDDPLTLGGVFLLIMLIGFFACYIPARRATKVNPIEALRYE